MSEWIRWISVSESKPKENHEVYLVSDGINVTSAYWDFSGFVGLKVAIGEITHWMEYPKARMSDYSKVLAEVLSYLDNANSTEVIYFLDTLLTKYCQKCGEKQIDLKRPCQCFMDVWHEHKDEE